MISVLMLSFYLVFDHKNDCFQNNSVPYSFSYYHPNLAAYSAHLKKTPWSESASELYRPSDSRLSAKIVPTFADRGSLSLSFPFLSRNTFLRILVFPFFVLCPRFTITYNKVKWSVCQSSGLWEVNGMIKECKLNKKRHFCNTLFSWLHQALFYIC
jgi:hypothetical protein